MNDEAINDQMIDEITRRILQPGYINSIICSSENFSPIRVTGNFRFQPNTQQGIPYYQFFDNESLQENYRNFNKRIFMSALNNDAAMKTTRTLIINKEVLDDEEFFAAIKSHIESYKRKYNSTSSYDPTTVIRISDEGYTLTREDYEKLSFVGKIAVDNCTEELRNNPNIIVQNGIFKYDEQHTQPVRERRQNFEDTVDRTTFHINHKLTEEEFETLANALKNHPNPAIELDYFDPNYYEEFLNSLQRHNIRQKINVLLIGYLLEDKSELYRRLENYPYEIDIVYSTCHDMIDRYQREPYSENVLHYSEIEGGGKTTLANYINVISFFEDFENKVQDMQYSPLEAAVYAKMQIDGSYIYDPDYNSSNTDDWDNTNLSQILNADDNGQRRAICLGFSTLYSAMLRRVNVPMFRYGTRSHERNIGRINDPKYGVDNICTCDITWDLQSTNNNAPSYTYFLLSPREWLQSQDDNGYYEPMTIAHTLALPFSDYYNNLQSTFQEYDRFYHPIGHDLNGYTSRMLELMEVVPETRSNQFDEHELYNNIYNLCAQGHLESVPEDKIMAAIENVFSKAGITDITSYRINTETSFDMRQYIFNSQPAIDEDRPTINAHDVTPLTPENARHYQETLTDDIQIFIDANTDNNQEQEIINNQNQNAGDVQPESSLEPDHDQGREPTQEPEFDQGREPTQVPGADQGREPTQVPGADQGREPTQEPEFNHGREPTQEPEFDHGREPTQVPESDHGREPNQEPESDHGREPTQEPDSGATSDLDELVVKTTPWQWVKDHKKQILIVLGLAAMAVSLYLVVTHLMPALIAANNAQMVSNSLAVMSKNAAQWHGAAPAIKAALHSSSEALAANVTSMTGLQTVFTNATGVWTIGGQSLGTAATAAAEAATKTAALVKGFTGASLATGLGGIGALGVGLLSRNKSNMYKEYVARIAHLRENMESMSNQNFTNELRRLLESIETSNLSNSEKVSLQKKLSNMINRRRKLLARNNDLIDMIENQKEEAEETANRQNHSM